MTAGRAGPRVWPPRPPPAHTPTSRRQGARPGDASFDRIIATCSVPGIPTAWTEQIRPGGVILADLSLGPRQHAADAGRAPPRKHRIRGVVG
ncbi:hypothetical protein [Streptomyces sp. MK37H]|uniref:hypothetical protein n=1 Tax=Streptomyces sp. MK37H TaxID=2699117 RepID=UPI001B386A20|nr:hypothetical protein [Streptomyces sp. MK37H]MBP8534623.1 hypothetical protein [Streptomyces sp. MK37H]